MSIPRDIVRAEAGLSGWNILTAYRGSVSHGMYVPKNDPESIDDKDVIAMCVLPPSFYLGPDAIDAGLSAAFRSPEEADAKLAAQMAYYLRHSGTREVKAGEWDIVIYEARKLVHLLLKGNPNVLSLLWLSPQFYIGMTDAGRLLINNRKLFVSKHVYESFVGYANDQLHRMTHMATDEAYMGAKRRALVEKYGFDAKNAAHLLRILRMGIEFLTEGKLYVERKVDNNELLEVKRGERSLDWVKERAAELFREAREAYRTSPLPSEPNYAGAVALCGTIIRKTWSARGDFSMTPEHMPPMR